MNLRNPATTAIAAVAGSLLSVIALTSALGATQQGPEKPPTFEQIDKNGDGAVTMTEAGDSWLASIFSRVDENNDGSISKSEYQKAVG